MMNTRSRTTAFIALLVVAATLFGILLSPIVSISQTKKDLQKQRDEINSKIELTKKLIKESEKQQKSTTRQVEMLNEQLALRDELIQSINGDIQQIDGEIGLKNEDIEKLKGEKEQLKKEYGRIIYKAYRNRGAYDKIMYVFASSDFHQAIKRFMMLQRLANARMDQMEKIFGVEREISSSIEELESDKNQKLTLADEKEREKSQVEETKREQQNKLSALKKEEGKLRDQQNKQKADRDKLTSKIQAVIAEEIRKENERIERERKAAEAKANAEKAKKNEGDKTSNTSNTTNSKTETKTENKTSTTNKNANTLAPETVAANADFEKNKGVLPWPVSAGVISSHFGKHAHPTLAQVTVNNNGTDFSTTAGANAIAIFSGTVTSVFNIPGAGQNVIITHGSYKTVYSGLSSVSVSVGDKVSSKQSLGTIQSDGEEYTLHFEVWKVGSEGGSAQNPELWIKKR
ncbi:MAG: murein hydrolase activator EnvC family protein [Flavobacteriales bacterium]